MLKIDPKLYTENGVTPDESLRNFTQNLNEVFTKLNQIRNIYSESHGKPKKDNQFNLKKLPKHHFKLILDTTKTISNFLVSSYEYQKNIQI